jgi:hypothetical protein
MGARIALLALSGLAITACTPSVPTAPAFPTTQKTYTFEGAGEQHYVIAQADSFYIARRERLEVLYWPDEVSTHLTTRGCNARVVASKAGGSGIIEQTFDIPNGSECLPG